MSISYVRHLSCLMVLAVIFSCSLHGQVGKKAAFQIKNVSINSELAEFGPAFYKQAGLIYATELNGTGKDKWSPRNAPHLDLTYARFVNTSDLSFLGTPAKLEGLNSRLHEGTVSFSSDFQTMYFTANYPKGTNGVNRLRLMQARWFDEKWTNVIELPFNNPDYSVGHPALSPDNKILYFASDMPGGYGGLDIYMVRELPTGWSQPENLGPAINSVDNEAFPFMSSDGTLYFASNHNSMGGLDVYFSRPAGNGTWQPPVSLPAPINSSADDFGFIIRADNSAGYFASNRSGGKGNDDIYSFTTSNVQPASVSCIVKGRVYEKDSNAGVVNALAKLINTKTSETEVATTDAAGSFTFAVDPETDYTLYVSKKGYFTEVRTFSTKGRDCTLPINQDIPLDIAVSRVPEEPITIVAGGGSTRPDLPLPVINNIYYDFDKWDIRPDAAMELDKIVSFMKENPDISIELLSHTDSRGKAEYNLELSQKRAAAAVSYIVSKGIASSQITSRGMGESKPVNKCKDGVKCTEEEYQQNRRTEFVIVGFK